MKPIILHENSYSIQDVARLKKKNRIWSEKNIYEKQLIELFYISNPHLIDNSSYGLKLQSFIKKRSTPNIDERGNWVYFPWSGVLMHTVNEKNYYKLRTNR